MKPPVRKPRGQSSLCVLAPSASGFSGNHLLQIQQEEIKPLVGTLDSRTRASSLCCVHLSFKELMQVELLGPPYPHSKQRFQNIPWRLSRELPPQPPAQRACSAPQPGESYSQHHPESSRQTGKTHPPSGPGFVGVFPLGYFYLLDKKVESTVLFVSSSNTTQVNPERRVFNYLCLVTRCSEKFQSSSFYFIQNHPSWISQCLCKSAHVIWLDWRKQLR